MNNTETKLKLLRQQIDEIDQNLIELINKRAECAIAIGNTKKQEIVNPVFYRPEREAQVLRKVMQKNKGPIANNDMAYIFRIIMSLGLALQQPAKIAFLGPEGTFSQAAVIKHFGPSVILSPINSISRVFQQVEVNKANFGVVPVENSTEGVVNQTLDELIQTPLNICGEIILKIKQNLLVNFKHRGNIKYIYSHPQSLAQCRNWLEQHLPNAVRVAVNSNAEAAKLVKNKPGSAAIAGDLASELYGLKKYAEHIEDNPENMTRFLIMGKQRIPPSGDDKTTILVDTTNKPGTLAHIAAPFAKHKLNITLPTLRPSRQGIWTYVFFLDIEGHQEDPAVKAALQELKAAAISTKIVGSYPRAIL